MINDSQKPLQPNISMLADKQEYICDFCFYFPL